MQTLIGGAATLGLLGLSLVIGVRLVRLGIHSGGPERWLGLYFVCFGAIASSLSAALYSSWASPALQPGEAVLRALQAGYFGSATLGAASLLVFTRRTFRPDDRAARIAVALGCAALALAAVGVGVTEGFRPRVLNGPAYWLHFALRLAGWCWVALESFAYWRAMRRRQALGLADPVVANRFLLWGLWGAAMAVTSFVDPGARLYYWWLTGSAVAWRPEVAGPIIDVMVPLGAACSLASAALLFLTFFPTRAYRRWLLRHAAAPV